MTLLIDTDVAIGVLIGRREAVKFFREAPRRELSISTISLAELFEGVINGRAPKADELVLRKFLRGMRIRIVSSAIAQRSGMIRADLRKRNHPFDHRTLDLFIAATALEHGLTLVTRNLKDFQDIPGIQLYPWDESVL